MIARVLIAVIMCVPFAGCTSLTDAQSSCTEQYSDFSPMWNCIRGRVAAGKAGDMKNDLGLRYMAYGDAINEKYKRGQISNADAKLALAQELSRANEEYTQRFGGGDRLQTYCQSFGSSVVCN